MEFALLPDDQMPPIPPLKRSNGLGEAAEVAAGVADAVGPEGDQMDPPRVASSPVDGGDADTGGDAALPPGAHSAGR